MKSIHSTKLVNSLTYTVIQCQECQKTLDVKGTPTCKKVSERLAQPCRDCHPVRKPQGGNGWWHQFGLDKNPYVYGPMPYKRTSQRWRLHEARQRGWLSWYWVDDYTDERLQVK